MGATACNGYGKLAGTTRLFPTNSSVSQERFPSATMSAEGQSVPAAQAFFARQPEYTMSGVIAFLQSTALHHEREASEWRRERRQLVDRCSALEQQCESHMRVEEDLVERVRMLEFALAQERSERNWQRMLGSSSGSPAAHPDAAREYEFEGLPAAGAAGGKGTKKGTVHKTGGAATDSSKLQSPGSDDGVATIESGRSVPLSWVESCDDGRETSADGARDFTAGGSAKAADGGRNELAGQWHKYTELRSHLDAVTCLAWSNSGSHLLSASQDGSLKLWNLKAIKALTKDGACTADIEPLVTYRGHQGPVLSAAIGTQPAGASEAGVGPVKGYGKCYSGGWDGCVRVWELPPPTHDLYDSVGSSKRREVACLQAHQDAIWSLCAHPTQRLLFTASADATIAVWSTADGGMGMQAGQEDEALVHLDDLVFPSGSSAPLSPTAGHRAIPACIAPAATSSNHLLAAYRHSVLVSFDLAASRASDMIALPNESSSPSKPAATRDVQPNAMAVHPVLALVLLAQEDGLVRCVSTSSGKVVSKLVAHRGAATSVSIDSSGLYAATGGCDGYLRIWDLRQQSLIHESREHGMHFGDSSVLVAQHPRRALLASAGSDSVVSLHSLS